MTKPTQARIILPALKKNLSMIKSKVEELNDQPVEIVPVVKADAYGHGSIEVAKELVKLGMRWLAVSCLEEATELKQAGVDKNIIILGPADESEIKEVVQRGFVQVISSNDELDLVESTFGSDRSLNKAEKAFQVILDVDTGMGRMGFLPEQMPEVSGRAKSISGIRISGIFSHLAAADSTEKEDKDYTESQIKDFMVITKAMKKNNHDLELISIANSAGIFLHPDSIMNAVRPGIALYGVKPNPDLDEPQGLEPVMRWVTRIAQVRSLPSGTFVSYGRQTMLKRRSRIALLPVGYADGLSRRIPPGFNLFTRGKPAPVTGVVTMDFTMIDVTDVPEANPGDRVLIMGKDSQENAQVQVRAEDHAKAAGTIPYEILTSVGKRVKRVYLEE